MRLTKSAQSFSTNWSRWMGSSHLLRFPKPAHHLNASPSLNHLHLNLVVHLGLEPRMYRCAGLQPVVFAARRNEPYYFKTKLAGAVGLEPTRPFGSSVNSGVQYHYAYTPIILIETIFRQHTLSGCTRGEARVRFEVDVEFTKL